MGACNIQNRLPSHAHLREVGPRDGFQAESAVIPTDTKIRFIEGLSKTGLRHIQAVSFVHPKKVPQMADAEEILSRLYREPGVIYSGLALNLAGVQRAINAGVDAVEVSFSASNTHSRKNAGMGTEKALEQVLEMATVARDSGLAAIGGVQCAFGCAYEGAISQKQVLEFVQRLLKQGVDSLCIADTTGMAGPLEISSLMEEVVALAGDLPVFLHLHDTRGLGLVNMVAGLSCGVKWFDTSFGGTGGCPFIPGAAGNLPTEESLYLMDRLGVSSGVDASLVADCSLNTDKITRELGLKPVNIEEGLRRQLRG